MHQGIANFRKVPQRQTALELITIWTFTSKVAHISIKYFTLRPIKNVQIFRIFHIFIYFEGNEINWVVGERNKGNCNDVCNKNHPGSTCDETSLNDLDEQKAKEIKISNGNQCRDWNDFNYGQGLSQCTAPSCCVPDSCQYDCSFSVTTACVISDDFNADHSRICPCISGGRLLYRIK